MMNEYFLGIVTTLKALLVLVFAFCYIMGGRYFKWIRRLLGSALLILGIIGFSFWQNCFSWFYLGYFPALIFALSQGYGVNDENLIKKIARRAKYGLFLGLSAVFIACPNGSWVLFGIQTVVSITSSVVLGAFNPLPAATDEEGLIAILSVILVPYMLKLGGM